MKTKPHIFVLLAFLMVAGMILSPPAAADPYPANTEFGINNSATVDNVYSFTETLANNTAYNSIDLREYNSGTVNFTLMFADGSTENGAVVIETVPLWTLGGGSFVLVLGSDSGFSTGAPPKHQTITYGMNGSTPGVVMFEQAYQSSFSWLWGGENQGIVFAPHTDAIIVGVSITSDMPVTITRTWDSKEFVTRNRDRTAPGGSNPIELVSWLMGEMGVIFAFLMGIWFWFNLIFIQNIVGVAALYFTGTGAYAMMSSRNPFQFFSKWFKAQKSFWEFMLNTMFQVVGIIGSVVQSVLKWL